MQPVPTMAAHVTLFGGGNSFKACLTMLLRIIGQSSICWMVVMFYGNAPAMMLYEKLAPSRPRPGDQAIRGAIMRLLARLTL